MGVPKRNCLFVCYVLCIINIYGEKKISRTDDSYIKSSVNSEDSGFIDLTKFTAREESHKPILRHHIAHFCKTLDHARACVNKCAKEGKPAFCGKDHICYCGHSYNKSAKDNSNAKQMYAQFKDLYKKYFGDNFHPSDFNEEN